MNKPKLREVAEAIRALVRGPVTTKFPFAPHEPAEAFRGKPKFDPEHCVGCGACAEVCPTRCIDVIDDVRSRPPRRRLVLHYDRCIFCGHCELNCAASLTEACGTGLQTGPRGEGSQKGIRQSREYDLACFDRAACVETIEHELVLCEVCGAVIGARKHLLLVAGRLGAKRFANPTLILVPDAELGLVEPDAKPRDAELLREDLMRVTCPGCRRRLVLQELWGG